MKINYLLCSVLCLALVLGSCDRREKEDSAPEVSGITINGKVTDVNGNPISGLKISTPERTRSAITRAGSSIQDSIMNAEKNFVEWVGDTGVIIIPDTIFTNASGEYQILNRKADFNFTGELSLIVIDESGAFASETGTITVFGSDYKPADGYKSFVTKNLDFTLQSVE